jgi:cysteinyl-tRNA synthetase, unknown class
MILLKIKKPGISFILVSLLFIIDCANSDKLQFAKADPGSIRWVYQLQNPKIEDLSRSGFSLAVIDYSKNGSDSKRFSKQELQQLVTTNVLPIAYISIGEAESYRFYWQNKWVNQKDNNKLTAEAPQWLGHTNPDWAGNHKVRYWNHEWRDNFIKPYLDKIIEQGFHGVYLDIIDGFEYWGDSEIYSRKLETRLENDPVDDEAEAARRMIELVHWISQYCREHSPLGNDFVIVPQNGERILLYDNDGSYLNAVSGIGVEGTWYDTEEKLSPSTVRERLQFLDKFIEKRKAVLSVDYVDNGDHQNSANLKRIKDYVSKCRLQKFNCYVATTDVELKTINRIKNIQP